MVLDLGELDTLRKAKSVAYNNLGLIYTLRRNKDKAWGSFLSGLSLREDIGLVDLISHSYLQIAEMYIELGPADSALVYHDLARAATRGINKKELLKERMWDYCMLKAEALDLKGLHAEAHMYTDSAIQIARTDAKNTQLTKSLILASKVCMNLNEIEMSTQEVTMALQVADSLNLRDLKAKALEQLIALDVRKRDYPNAYLHQKELTELTRELQESQSTIELSSNAYRYELDRLKQGAGSDKRLRDLQQEQIESRGRMTTILYIFLGTVLSLLLVVSYLFYQNRKRHKKSLNDNDLIKTQKEEIERTNRRLTKANELLEESLAQKSVFMSKMSHEIRTPMNAIGGLTEILLDQSLTPDQEQIVRNINHSSLRLTALVDDILDYSRLEGGRVQLHPQDFNLSDLLEEIKLINKAKADTNNTLIHLRISPTIPRILHGDADRLGQVLNNLISNAVKFTEGGHVHVRVFDDEQQNGKLRIGFEIEDNGIGIAEDKLHEIFEEFHQGGDEIHTRFGGTGLGLAISKQLVELLGGAISVQSEQRKGSTFAFYIFLEPQKNSEQKDIKEKVDLSGKKLLFGRR